MSIKFLSAIILWTFSSICMAESVQNPQPETITWKAKPEELALYQEFELFMHAAGSKNLEDCFSDSFSRLMFAQHLAGVQQCLRDNKLNQYSPEVATVCGEQISRLSTAYKWVLQSQQERARAIDYSVKERTR